jgi:hypothetical protein
MLSSSEYCTTFKKFERVWSFYFTDVHNAKEAIMANLLDPMPLQVFVLDGDADELCCLYSEITVMVRVLVLG